MELPRSPPTTPVRAPSSALPVLRGYIERGSLFLDNAAAKVGL